MDSTSLGRLVRELLARERWRYLAYLKMSGGRWDSWLLEMSSYTGWAEVMNTRDSSFRDRRKLWLRSIFSMLGKLKTS